MIKKQNKRVQITLSSETFALLESLKLRFNLTTTQLVNQSLRVLAANVNRGKGHSFKVHFSDLCVDSYLNLDDMIKIVKDPAANPYKD